MLVHSNTRTHTRSQILHQIEVHWASDELDLSDVTAAVEAEEEERVLAREERVTPQTNIITIRHACKSRTQLFTRPRPVILICSV